MNQSNLPDVCRPAVSPAAQHYVAKGTLFEHQSSLRVNDAPHLERKTGIICTIGPSCRSVPMLKELILAGMNIARLNFSHGTHEYHKGTIDNVRQAVRELGGEHLVGIALDTKGPEIRTGLLAAGATKEIELKPGDLVRLVHDENAKLTSTKECLYVDYANMAQVVAAGSHIYIDDGLISLVVQEIDNGAIICVVENGGLLGSQKGVNLPGAQIDLPPVSDKDVADLQFGVEQGVDIIFASFMRSAAGVKAIRENLGDNGKHIRVVAKIENQQGLTNIDDIIAETDGVMVARGDLGIEIPTEKVFLAQKMIIAKCNLAGKPVICATQMLESMVHKARPTRAEGSDVANAVLDGADCVMLSGETAKGDFPIEAVKTMHRICHEAESAAYHTRFFEEMLRLQPKPTDTVHTVAIAAASAAVNCFASAIIVTTTSGRTARFLSQCRPTCPIISITRNAQVAPQMHLLYGVLPILYPAERLADWPSDVDARIACGVARGKQRGFIRTGEWVVVVTGWKKGSGFTNTIRIINAP